MNEPYRKKYPIHSYEVDAEGRAHLLSLLNFLQDAAGDHAGSWGLSATDVLRKGLTWILSRYHLKIVRYPLYGQAVEVTTWASGKKDFFALRDFEVLDEKGRTLLGATTSWLLIRSDNKQPVRLDNYVPDGLTCPRRAVDDDFPPLPLLEAADAELTIPVLTKDLDFNKHVNNAVYVQWALEAVPADVMNAMRPMDVEVSFRAEAFYGERIISKIQDVRGATPRAFLHQVYRPADGKELTRLRTVWA